MNLPNFQRLAYSIYLRCREGEIVRANTQQKEKWIRDIGHFDENSLREIVQRHKVNSHKNVPLQIYQ